MEKLTTNEISRYARHLALPEVGVSGQEKLKASRVLIIGTGGLGSPVSLYLAAAGVGTIGLIDFDVVDSSNLQRQILFGEDSIGKSKIQEAHDRLHNLNSQITLSLHEERLTSENALDIFTNYDLIIDGSDNFPTRYLVNDTSVLLGIPYVFGSIFRFSGQVSVFGLHDGPCYRCLYPEPPDPKDVPNCNEDGVFGVLPGVIGTLMATEAIKLILKIGKPLAGRLLSYYGLSMKFNEFNVNKNPDCPICGEHPTITKLIDYDEFCNGKPLPENITVEEYSKYRTTHDHILLDVREHYEFDITNLGGMLIPLGEIADRLDEIPHDKEIVVMCSHGVRSLHAMHYLKTNGYTKVRNLRGGIKAWSEKVDSSLPMY